MLDRLDLDSGVRRQLVEYLTVGSTESSPPYIVGIAAFLTNVIPVINNSFELLFNLYSIRPTVVKSVDVETIRQGRIYSSDTDSNILDYRPVIFDEWEKLEEISSSTLM